ncbi:MAG TPA: nicotinate-nucleotide adenylyltransferase [Tissierellaceae bacterium]|nr:nicotinate-nucleotide adenylyltransferase [Tissierellaceae bacterium]
MKIGIMGGTFNPIHHGHLILSEYIRIHVNLDKIIFIPTGNPPHKDRQNILDGGIRLEMVRLAIKNNPYFTATDIEVKRPEISYTIDTIIHLKEIYRDCDLYMIIGSDTLLSLYTWKDISYILGQVKFIVADRLGLHDDDVEKEIKRLNNKYSSNIISVDSPVIDISSTLIRQRLKANLSVKYLLPEAVEEYIIENKYYLS